MESIMETIREAIMDKIKNNLWIYVLVLIVSVSPQLVLAMCNTAMTQTTPDTRFADNGDGTVSDKSTGLTWMQCSYGQVGSGCAGAASRYTWQEALTIPGQVNQSGFAGSNDWRLPNEKELLSIVEFACYEPAINVTLFPATLNDFYWSSSSVRCRRAVYFVNGAKSCVSGFELHPVRLVRG
jgi:hypothetical protein